MASSPGPIIGRTLGHYRIVEQIRAGGMGVVYRARDERLERDVALKILPPGTLADDSARKRFRQEALALSRLNHPNIATVHDFDTQEEIDFLVTELVSGLTLDEKVMAGPLPEKEVLQIGVQLADGLAAAHREGVVHRDLKPGNLRLTPEGRLKILDFGLAKRVDPADQASVTQSVLESGLMGTLAYMSPEQLRGEKVDSRADIWAAGVALYELASGRRPFDGKTSAALADEILHAATPSPRLFELRLSSRLADIILKCLEKDAENRYQSARELLVDLRRMSMPTGTAVISAPRRRVPARALAIAGVVVLAILVTTAMYFYIGHNQKLAASAAPRITSLAVLPLANLSGDANQEYFSDGMTEALIADLSKIKALKVISRTSVMRYKGTNKPLPEIARELGVDGIIEGSVLRSGDRVRITAQLINAASDTHVWGDNFDRDLRDVLALQSEVARAIAQEIRVAVTPTEQQQLGAARPVNPEAHELYLKGRYYWWKRDAPEMGKAIGAFEQAIAIDPNYANAYAGLADAYSTSANNGFQPPTAGNAKAKVAALKAVELDDSLAEAHVALGRVYRNYDWDWSRAEAEYRRAIALNPNSADAYLAYAALLTFLARQEEAVAANRRAIELDPLATRITAHLAGVLYCARRYDEAIATAKVALELDPGDILSHVTLGKAYMQKRMYAEAVTALERAYSGNGGFGSTVLVGAYAAAGRTDDAHRALAGWMAESRRHYLPSYFVAMAHVGVGKDEEVFDWLEKSYRQREPGLPFLSVDPMWDQFRADPRFIDLLHRMNLKS
jgi:serine/threonine protein kinase/tetratricopeptide (TPR) repeat protein